MSHNVTAFEVHPAPGRTEVREGIVHAFAIANDCRESRVGLNDFFHVVPGGLKIVGTCFVQIRDFDPVRTESINTTALFGAGWIDQISSRSILHQNRSRSFDAIGKELVGDLTGIKPGRARVLPDGRIGKFGWKAQFATLQEFVASACANELGLGNPLMEQAQPYAHGHVAKVNPDLDQQQFGALVAFVNTLPRPIEVAASDPGDQGLIEHGKRVFQQIGCANCHTPELGGVSGVYSDLLLHRLTSASDTGGGYSEVPTVPLPDGHPLPDEWKTPPLWGVADSALTSTTASRRPWRIPSSVTAAMRSVSARRLKRCQGEIGRRSFDSCIASRLPRTPSPPRTRGLGGIWRQLAKRSLDPI